MLKELAMGKDMLGFMKTAKLKKCYNTIYFSKNVKDARLVMLNTKNLILKTQKKNTGKF